MIGADKQIVRDYKDTFSPDTGKRVLEDLNRMTGALRPNKPINNDALLMAYKSGQASVIIHIYSKVNRKLNEPKQERAITNG